MLFWLFVILTVVFAYLFFKDCLDVEPLWFVCMVGSAIITVIMIITLACTYIGIDGTISSNEARYDMLVYQYENDIYDNDNDIGKRELIKEIQDWNEDVAKGRATQYDFWIGIFVPNFYYDFEYIPLDGNALSVLEWQ